MCSQLASRPAPSDDTMPMPVIATLRPRSQPGLRLDLAARPGRRGSTPVAMPERRGRRRDPARLALLRAGGDDQRHELARQRHQREAAAEEPPRHADLVTAQADQAQPVLDDDAVDVGGELEACCRGRRRRGRGRPRGWPGTPRGSRRAPPSRSCRRGAACARRCHRRRPCRAPRPVAGELVVRRQHRAVADLDGRRGVDQQLEIALERQLALIEMERVVEREEDAGRRAGRPPPRARCRAAAAARGAPSRSCPRCRSGPRPASRRRSRQGPAASTRLLRRG